MIEELRNSAVALADGHRPVSAVRVNFSPGSGVGSSGERGRRNGSDPAEEIKGLFAAKIGIRLGDGPELR